MSNGHSLLRAFSTIGLILTLGVSMSACSATMSWKEEVLLHDGSKVIAERFYNLGGYPTIDSRERKSLDETVTFTLPGSNKKVTWKTDFRDSVSEANSLNLLVLDIVNGEPVSFFVCEGHEMIPKGNHHDRDHDHDEEDQVQGAQAFSR